MRVTSKGQVTIPKYIRDKIGVRAGSNVEFIEKGGEFVLTRAKTEMSRHEHELAELRAHLDKISGTGISGLTADEIMEMTRGPFEDVDAG